MDYKEIKTTNINKFFGKRQVLNNVTISLKKSEIVTLLGPNGSGKTTLFYIIAGLVAPEEGKVFINNIDVTELPMYQRARLGLGYLPQEVSIFRGLTVEENIEVILSLRIEDKIEKQEELKRLLEEFSIFHLRKSSALALSGGEKRRLEIARALAGNPEFILLDEPFAGVDPIAVGDLKKLILSLKKRNIGVLITDHNVRETLDITDKAYVLYNGVLLAEGSQNEIINNQNVQKLYLGDTFL